MRATLLTATRWGAVGVLGGAAAGVLLVLPFRPETDEGFAELGWFLLMLAVGGLLALLAGAACVHRGLVRAGAPHPTGTALAFVPVAVVLGAATAGVGAFAAPAAAHWLVDGFARRPGWGVPRTAGRAQRVVLAVGLSAGLAAWGLSRAGHELGGRVGGTALTWAVVLPAVVVPPVLLLRRVVPWRLLVAGVGVGAALLGLAAPGATADAHPTPERLEQIATDLPVPDGQEVTDVRTTVLRDGYWEVPLTVLSTGGPPPGWGAPPPADEFGRTAALAWQEVLGEQGWSPTPSAEVTHSWLPEQVRATLAGAPQYELGLWTRASVVPHGSGALVVLSVRP